MAQFMFKKTKKYKKNWKKKLKKKNYTGAILTVINFDFFLNPYLLSPFAVCPTRSSILSFDSKPTGYGQDLGYKKPNINGGLCDSGDLRPIPSWLASIQCFFLFLLRYPHLSLILFENLLNSLWFIRKSTCVHQSPR